MNRKMMTAALAGLMMAGTFASQAMADENTISLMLMGTEADSFVDDYVEIINNFNETNEYGVTVNAEFYENEQMKTKLATLMAANNAPDVFFTYELAYLEPFVNGGKVADLTDYLENDPEWKSTFSEGTLELLEYDGRNFAIPTQISLCVMFYNKQIFADNGLEIPKTYEEFLQVCDTLKNNGGGPMAMSGADACVTLTGMDEQNVIISLYAREKGIDKIITKVDKTSVFNMVEQLGLTSVVSPKDVIANHILRFVRAHKSEISNDINRLYKIADKIEALEFTVQENFLGLNTSIKDLKLKRDILICGIVRNNEFILPRGDSELNVLDRVIIITDSHQISELNEILK